MALILPINTLDNDINNDTNTTTIILEVFEKTEVQSRVMAAQLVILLRVFSSVMILTSKTLSLSLSASAQLSLSTIEQLEFFYEMCRVCGF